MKKVLLLCNTFFLILVIITFAVLDLLLSDKNARIKKHFYV